MGLLIIGAMMAGTYSIVNDIGSDQGGYGVAVDDKYETAFDSSSNISNEMRDSWSSIQNYTTNKGASYQIITLVPDVLSLMKNVIVLPFSLADNTFKAMVEYIGLPDWIYDFMITSFTIILVFGFVALVLRWRYT